MEKDEKSKGLAETDLAGSCAIVVNDAGTVDQNDTRLTQPRSPTVPGLPKGFTYFVRDGDMIKIGSSMRPADRISNLQTGSSRPLEVLAVVSQEIADEFGTHQLFDHLRVRGEWFRADQELLYFIEGVKAAAAALPEPVRPALEHPGALAALNAKAASQGCANFFTASIDIRRGLTAKGKAAGWDTPIGHACSNVIRILDALHEYERPAWAAHETQTLPYLMNKQIERLAALSVAAGL